MLTTDTKVTGPNGTFSYGPRRSEGGHVLPPYGDKPAEFWSVYREDAEGFSQWLADFPTEAEATAAARAAAGLTGEENA